MARLRLSITDDPAHQPDGVRVVGRQRFGWVALLAAYAALFCLPAFRNTMVDQAYIVTTGEAPAWLAGMTNSLSMNEPAKALLSLGMGGRNTMELNRERVKKVLAQHPADVELHLGGLILGLAPPPSTGAFIVYDKSSTWKPGSELDPRLAYLNELRRRFPGNAAVLATELRYYSQNSIQIQRREELRWGSQTREERLIDPSVAAEVLAIISEGERADPGNAYFPTLAAATYVGAREDSKAVEALHRAAQCSFWKDYTWAEGGGAERLLVLAYGDHGLFMHTTPLAAISLPHYALVRATYQVLSERVDSSPEGWQLRTDMLRVGAMLRDEGETLIGRLVGAALQEIAFDIDGARKNQDHTGGKTEAANKQRIQEVLTQAGLQAPTMVAAMGREADRLAEFQAKRPRIQRLMETFEVTMRPAIQRELLGLHLLGNLLGCLALWAGTVVIVLVGSKMKLPSAQALSEGLPRPVYIGLIALSIGALLIPLGAAGVSPANAPLDYGLAFFWLVFVVRPLLMRPGVATAWRPAVIGGLAVAAVSFTLAALWPWEFATHTQGYWMQQLGFLQLFGQSPEQSATNPMGFVLTLGPAPVVVFISTCTILAMLCRRGMFLSWMEGMRGVARVLTAVLAVGYLVFTLVHAPATLRDGRIAAQSFRNETAILDQR